jgi:diguanylate cyclase (GGDEF)-like protein
VENAQRLAPYNIKPGAEDADDQEVRGSGRRRRLPLLRRSLRLRLALTFAIGILPVAAVGALALDRLHTDTERSAAAAREAVAVGRLGSLLALPQPPAARVAALLARRTTFAPPVRAQAARVAAAWRARSLPRARAAYRGLAAAETREQARRADTAASDRRVAELALALGAALLLATLAFWRLGRRVLPPLRKLQDAAVFLGRSQLDVRLPVERNDEIGDLARSVNDLAERLQSTRRALTHQAQHDSQTLLPNRAHLADRLEQALDQARRSRRPPVLLWVGLDNLDPVQGGVGDESADRLLRAVSERIAACVPPSGAVARIGTSDFVVLLEDLTGPESAIPLAERILDTLARPLDAGGPGLTLRASVGIAAAAPDSRDADALLRNASLALQSARARGGERHALFTEEMHAEAAERLSLEADLREAIERGRLTLAFQPVYDLKGGTITGAEALVRWNHPARGPISPGSFIPLAESTGLVVPLGLHVLTEACLDGVGLERRGAPLRIAVNLSRRQLDEPDLVADVSRVLRETRFDPERLVLEVTESAVAKDGTSAIARLRELKELGIAIALDDFGTGYSSLGSIRSLPVDIVKIDRSFVGDLRAGDERSLEFVRAVVDLSRALGLRTVAEGIEDEAQLQVLRELECDEGQGYHLAKPMELAGLDRLLGASRGLQPPRLAAAGE